MDVFFGGSVEGTVALLLQLEDSKLTAEEPAGTKALIDRVSE